jgi:hypothetical protein
MTSSILRKSDRDLTIAGVGHVTLMSYGSVLEINTGNSPSAPSTGQVVASPLFLALLLPPFAGPRGPARSSDESWKQ